MTTPDEALLLSVWDRAADLPRGRRALALLSAARPGEDFTQAPLGLVDRLLLDLRETLFGPALSAVARCPRCAETLECELETRHLRDEAPTPALASEAADDAPPIARIELEGARIACRLPTPLDLDAIAHLSGRDALLSLLSRLLISADRDGVSLPPGTWNEALITAAAAALQRLDPQADTRLRLSCPACAHAWQETFDPAAYLWAELDAWAHALLREIDFLARAYGWTESDILALSPRRRRHYLALLAT